MAEDVAVTKISVDYAFGGKAFSVVFAKPSEIRSIIFHRDELEKLKAALGAPQEIRLDPSTAVQPAAPNGAPTEAVGKEIGSDSSLATVAANRGLWWHTGACTFFHPEKL